MAGGNFAPNGDVTVYAGEPISVRIMHGDSDVGERTYVMTAYNPLNREPYVSVSVVVNGTDAELAFTGADTELLFRKSRKNLEIVQALSNGVRKITNGKLNIVARSNAPDPEATTGVTGIVNVITVGEDGRNVIVGSFGEPGQSPWQAAGQTYAQWLDENVSEPIAAAATSLQLIGDQVEADAAAALDPVTGAIAQRVRFDAPQTLTSDEQAVVRSTVGAADRRTISFVHVDSFGADSTGVESATAAISEALVASRGPILAGARRNRVVMLGAGVYRLTQPLTISTTNTILRGQGQRKTVLLIDHTAGPGISFTAEGDSSIEALSILSSATRAAAPANDAMSGIISESGPAGGTYRNKLLDLEVSNQPGSGIIAYSPELMEIKRVNANGNRGSAAVLIDGRNIRNLSNEIGQMRLRDNLGWGLIIRRMTAQDVSTVEALNNTLGGIWFDDVTASSLRGLDVEAFELRETDPNVIGLQITGRGNTVIGGNFYSLGRAIRLLSAPNTTVITPSISGKDAAHPITVAISLDGGSGQSNIDISTGALVTTTVQDESPNSMVRLNGYPSFGTMTRRKVNTSVAGSYNPDFSRGSYFRLLPSAGSGTLTIGGPSNLDPRGGNTSSQRVTFEFVQPASEVIPITFGSNYRHFFSMSGATPGSVTIVEFEQTSQNNRLQQVAPNTWVPQ